MRMESGFFVSEDPNLDPDWIGPGSGLDPDWIGPGSGSGLDPDPGSQGGQQNILYKITKLLFEELDFTNEGLTAFPKP